MPGKGNHVNIPKRALAIAAAAIAACGLAFGVSGTAHAATVTQHGSYTFNSDSPNVFGGDNAIRATPFSANSVFPDASESLTASGVALSATGEADAGIIYPLGRLSSLFDANGQFVPPVIDGTGLANYNLYFDTNGDSTYFGYPGGSATYTYSAFDGDNKCALGPVNGAAPVVSCDGTWAGNNAVTTAIPDTPANEPYTMLQIKNFFAANTTGDTDPLVWAWIGIGDNASGTVTGTIASVDGSPLVTVTTSPPAAATVTLSAGHVVAGSLLPNRAEVAWTATPAAAEYKVTLVGPNFPGGRTNTVKVAAAYYTGLADRHTYAVYVTPETASGVPDGAQGHVTFVTP